MPDRAGGGGAPPPITDVNGFAEFSVDNLSVDQSTVSVSAGGVASNVVTVTITPTE